MPESRWGKRMASLGAWAGAICAVHCVLTAVALGLLSVAGFGFLNNPKVEAAFLIAVLVTGFFALWHGVKRHHSWTPGLVFVAGLSLIAAAHFAFPGDVHSGDPVAVTFATAGALLVATFQFVNLRMQHRGCSHKVGKGGHAVEKA